MKAIAIDGPAAAGKTTTAKMLAEKLGYLYVDTGAMYRASAVKYRDTRSKNVKKMLQTTAIRVEKHGVYGQNVYIDGVNVTGKLREKDISMLASTLSKEPCVRRFLLDLQRSLAEEHDVVMEGRDIGTVILPNADTKIFLTADLTARAERRLAELRLRGDYNITLDAVREEMRRRDEQDRTRKEAPLRQAEGSILIDNTELNAQDTVQAILTLLS